MNKKRIDILYQCDDNFAFLTGVSVTSLLFHAASDIRYNIYILTLDMSDENRRKFFSLKDSFPNIDFEISFLDASFAEQEVRTWNVPDHRGSYVTYYKLLLDHYFADTDVKRIIHIGADTLVTGDLHELIDFDFQGMPIAMNWSEKLYERYFPRKYKYCIAEMVFFNLPEWRKCNGEARVKDYFVKIGDIHGSKDQGILNMVFQNEMAQLPLKFNVYGITFYFSFVGKRLFNNAPVITNDEIKDAYAHPQIIHIPRTFLYRPHERGSREPLRKIWIHYMKRSPWYDLKPYPVYPPLGAKEKFLRFMFLTLPRPLNELVYIMCRHGYGYYNSVKCDANSRL